MGRAVTEFCEALLVVLRQFSQVFRPLWDFLGSDLVGLAIRNAEAAGLALPLSAMVTAATLCLIAGLLQFATRWRAKAKVFISYEHGQGTVAELIAKQLQNKSIVVYKLPFVDAPKHDELLDDVRNSIVRSNLILCRASRTCAAYTASITA